MEMSSQLQAAATLLLCEEPLITGQELGGTHGSSGCCGDKKNLLPVLGIKYQFTVAIA